MGFYKNAPAADPTREDDEKPKKVDKKPKRQYKVNNRTRCPDCRDFILYTDDEVPDTVIEKHLDTKCRFKDKSYVKRRN